MRKFILNEKYLDCKDELINMITDFDSYNEILGNPERNVIKKIPFKGDYLTIKSFKKPHLINKFVYRYFRKSKARRSFEHGTKLLKLNILNPEPLAYIENFEIMGITSSYYISKYVSYDFTLRELYDQSDSIECVKAFARFSYYVHTKGVYIKDNTPGNTLIIRTNNGYEMYLVDLNRMEFHEKLSFDIKMKSLSNNIKEQPYLDLLMEEYAKVSGYPLNEIKSKITHYQKEFNRKIESKIKFKRCLKKLLK